MNGGIKGGPDSEGSGKNLAHDSGTGSGSHFFHDLLDITMDGLRGKRESLGNFFIGKTFCKAIGYFGFPFGKSELFLDRPDIKFMMQGNPLDHNESAGISLVVRFE